MSRIYPYIEAARRPNLHPLWAYFCLFCWQASCTNAKKKKKKKKICKSLRLSRLMDDFFSALQTDVIEMWATWKYLFHNALIAVYILKHKYFVLEFNAEIVKAIVKCFNTAIRLQVAGQPICCRGMLTAMQYMSWVRLCEFKQVLAAYKKRRPYGTFRWLQLLWSLFEQTQVKFWRNRLACFC